MNRKLLTAASRSTLPARGKPHKSPLGLGLTLGYRKPLEGAGAWVVIAADGKGGQWAETFAKADDLQTADGIGVLSFDQASVKARQVAAKRDTSATAKPLATVAQALEAYELSLKVRGRSPANGRRVARLLAGSPLLERPVAGLQVDELKAFRNQLAGTGVKPQSVNRDLKGLRAALAEAAEDDPRILNSDAWRSGLKALEERDRENRNVILEDDQVRAIVTAAYAQGDAFGLLVELLAVTGARQSQVVKLKVADVLRNVPAVMMPVSAKGKGEKPITHRKRWLAEGLAARLRLAIVGRAPGEALLPNAAGCHREAFRRAVVAAGLDPDLVTPYALRHSAIVRLLNAGFATKIVADLHDTSITMIEKNYAASIADHADDRLRQIALDTGRAVLPVAA